MEEISYEMSKEGTATSACAVIMKPRAQTSGLALTYVAATCQELRWLPRLVKNYFGCHVMLRIISSGMPCRKQLQLPRHVENSIISHVMSRFCFSCHVMSRTASGVAAGGHQLSPCCLSSASARFQTARTVWPKHAGSPGASRCLAQASRALSMVSSRGSHPPSASAPASSSA